MITLTLPLPPSVNTAYANLPGKGRIKTKAYRGWVKNADAHYLTQKRSITPTRVKSRLLIRVPVNMRGDVSNRIKLIEDYLVSREITLDDATHEGAGVERAPHVATGMCEVVITEAQQ